jgi:hypothetical protein
VALALNPSLCKPRRYIHDSKRIYKGLFSRCIHQEDVADAVPYWMHQKQQVMLGRRNLHDFPFHEREKMKQIKFASKDYVREQWHQKKNSGRKTFVHCPVSAFLRSDF